MIEVGIIGATGYTGLELLRLLAGHREAHVRLVTSRSEAGVQVASYFPSLRQAYAGLSFEVPDLNQLAKCDVIFFATPHGVAQSMMADLIALGKRVIDLSADFRLKDIPLWEKWYNQQHQCPELVEQAVYGLPEVNREAIKNAQLIACPGCYPTSVQLGFLPLLEKGLVDLQSLIANSASGVSGAGRKASIAGLYCEASENFKAYGTSGHRHLPEIIQGLTAMSPANETPKLTFIPHLLPMIRGIHSTLYATLKDVSVDLQALFEARYAQEPFVDVLPAGENPETQSVRGTNMCQISVVRPQGGDTVVVMVAEDNLTKGASGQAIQNMNLMFGLGETVGLELPAVSP